MRFGKDWDEFKNESSGGGSFARVLKEGDLEVFFLTEPEEWIGYLEHYNTIPGKFSFPCTQEEDCPGCNADDEKMRSKSRKVMIPCLVEEKWVNIYKFPKKFADRVAKRAEKTGSIMERTYVITRTGTSVDTDYDIERGDPVREGIANEFKVPDMEKMLQDAYSQSWDEQEASEPIIPKKQKKKEVQDDEPPF